ncbi:hypothetical protein [Methylobacterium oryzae]|uniref:MarR family transcriptional regulator n=1 Tax=Methylobacterium oryzae TaxID=334852 RepID=A0ABU7TL72_9HYPH
MTGSLGDELKRANDEVEEIASGLRAAIQKVQVDAAQAVVRLVDDADARKASLLVRISHLQALVADSPPAESMDANPEPRQSGLSATDVILTALLEGPMSSNALDKAVMDQGLRKASAEKAKWVCRTKGWATHAKRIWTITPQGRDKILGQDSTQET